MNNEIPLNRLFQQLLEKEDFSSALEYDKEEIVAALSLHERELLSLLLIRHAEKQFIENSIHAEYCIQRAKQIAPANQKVILQASHVLAGQTSSSDLLKAAADGYALVHATSPTDANILFHWGSVLVQAGRIDQDANTLMEAERLLQKAADLLGDQIVTRQPMYSWLRAQIWHALARQSGEASDYSRAVKHYQDVVDHDIKVPFFWNDYANALIELGSLMKRSEVYVTALDLYRKAIRLDPRYFTAQFNLGVCYQRLFENSFRNNLFWQAHEQYSHCRILQDKHPLLSNSWGRLLLTQGKIQRDGDLLRQACDQLERALVADKHNIDIAVQLCEAFILCGGITEELSMLRHAETTLQNILQADPDNYDAWCTLGLCKYELGYYFGELPLLKEAFESYSHAKTIKLSNMKAWYGLASCTLVLGEIESDLELLKSSLDFFAQAAELEGPFFPQFWNDWGVAAMKLAELIDHQPLLELAIEKYEQAIDLDLKMSDAEFVDPEWLYNYGCAFDFLGDLVEDITHYEKAIQILARVIEIDPNYTQAKYNLAVAYSHLGESVDEIDAFKKSCELFQEFIQYEPDDGVSWNEWGSCLIYIAVLVKDPARPSYMQQYLAEAEEKFLRALMLGHLPAYYNLACVYSLLGEYGASIAHLEKAEANKALPSMDEVLHDEWLDAVRHTEEFRRFWSHLLSKYGSGE